MSDSRQFYREPMFNAPFPVTVLAVTLVVLFGVQTFFLGPVLGQLVMTPDALRQGRWWTLISTQFLHSGLMHVLINAIGAFIFGTPVVRLLGLRNSDIALFYLFFLLCGVLGVGADLLVTQSGGVGASAGVSALWGGAARLLGRRGGLAPMFDRKVLLITAAFAIVNVVFGLLGPFIFGTRIGWVAHIAGFVAGMLLIGVFGKLAGRLR